MEPAITLEFGRFKTVMKSFLLNNAFYDYDKFMLADSPAYFNMIVCCFYLICIYFVSMFYFMFLCICVVCLQLLVMFLLFYL